MTTLEGQTNIRTRIDAGIGWVNVDHRYPVDLHVFQRQALEAVAELVRDPSVQTIAVADFHSVILNAAPHQHAVDDDPAAAAQLSEQCREVTSLLWDSSKTLVVRRANRGNAIAPSESRVYVEPLTFRERQVLSLACEGASARDIAASLFISERTVETHIGNGYRKLGINSRLELVRRAAEFGL